jgi:hypothetical protein
LNRKPSLIPTLIAARVRPIRRAPAAASGGSAGNGLRLRLDDQAAADLSSAAPVSPGLHIDQAQQIAAALRIADTALGEMQARLAALEGMLPATRGVRRLSPQIIVALQVEVDSTVDAVAQLVDSTSSDGRRLLDGGWSATILDATDSVPRSIQLESCRPQTLGAATIGFLSSVAEGETNALRGGRVETVRSIVHTASGQVSRFRETITDFLDRAIRPLLAAGEVMAENLAAQVCAFDDPAFAVQTSQFSRADALLNTIPANPPGPAPSAENLSGGMRLVHE